MLSGGSGAGRHCRAVIVGVVLGCSLGGDATAQTVASIFGQVKDESGAVLPGVTVTVTSPALQVPQIEEVTNVQGEYRISPLPVGVYSVRYDLSGFEAVRHENLRLTVGFAARVDIVLKVGALEESVTVSGASPVVDVTQTSASTQFTREALEILPSSRSGWTSLVALAPGARSTWDVGGSGAAEQPTFRAFGQGGEAWTTIEGIVSQAFQSSASGVGNYTDYNAFDEARVSTVGNGAEMPTRGMQIVAVVKSGGNQFHGGGFANYTPVKWVANNVDDELLKFDGVNKGAPLKKRYDAGGDAGGKLIENKLWWYVAARRRNDNKYELTGVKDDGTRAENIQLAYHNTAKLSYQMNPSNRFIAFNQHNHKFEVSDASATTYWTARTQKPTPNTLSKLEWQFAGGDSLVAQFQSSRFYYHTDYDGPRVGLWKTDVVPPPTWRDQFTGELGGDAPQTGRMVHEENFQQSGSVTIYKPDLFLGNHQFKAGFEYIDATLVQAYVSRESGNYQLTFNNGVATQMEAWLHPTTPHDVTHDLGFYVSDSWTVARRLTLNLGFRGGHNTGFIPGACREATDWSEAVCHDVVRYRTFNSFVPRLHAAFDVTGDGRNIIKGGWGRFAHKLYVGTVAAADPFTRSGITYRWRDLNGNRDYDPGEVNLDLNGPDFISITGGSNTVPNPNLQQPFSNEFSLSYERQLMTNWGLRLTGIYSRRTNSWRTTNLLRPRDTYTIPVTRPDPGPDGVAGNADDPGRDFTYYEYPAALRGAAFVQNTTINDDALVSYRGFEVAISKRLADKWMLLASYSGTKINIPYIAGLSASEQGSSIQLANDTPNDEINTAQKTYESTFKVSTARALPWDVMVSFNNEWRSGEPWARQVVFRGGNTIPNITLNVDPIGTERLPSRNLMSLSAEKGMRLFGSHKLSVRTTVFNLVNANTVMNVNRQSGPRFKNPAPASAYPAIMAPRTIELGVRYTF